MLRLPLLGVVRASFMEGVRVVPASRCASRFLAVLVAGVVGAAEGGVELVQAVGEALPALRQLFGGGLLPGLGFGQRGLGGAGGFFAGVVFACGTLVRGLRVVLGLGGAAPFVFGLLDVVQFACTAARWLANQSACCAAPGSVGAGESASASSAASGCACQSLALALDDGLQLPLFLGDGVQLAALAGGVRAVGRMLPLRLLLLLAAAGDFGLQAGQHRVQLRVGAGVGMLGGAANRAGRVVFQRGAQGFDVGGAGGFGAFQRAFGLREGGGEARELGVDPGQRQRRRPSWLAGCLRLCIQRLPARLLLAQCAPDLLGSCASWSRRLSTALLAGLQRAEVDGGMQLASRAGVVACLCAERWRRHRNAAALLARSACCCCFAFRQLCQYAFNCAHVSLR